MAAPNYNPIVDAYAGQVADFAKPIVAHLRDLIHATCPEVAEEVKWGIPHFNYSGEVMCIYAAYNKHCSFSFWKDSLMADARLRRNAELPAAKRFMGKLTSLSDLPADAELIDWIKEAMSLNDRSVILAPRKSKEPKEREIPAAFAAALTAAPEIKAIFDSKSASFRKEYNTWIGEAKTDGTRVKRIEESLSWIVEGKGRFWKYVKSG
ncbi:hypothetical protein HF251_36800 [Rhizobium leguminosarum]|uniref:DUF1801 domain-containing protein n=1 Tax=Rhizobium leguminosarum TaxID=384 RepID=UPI001C92855A|nr:DUF1801 domain-containing protein [Rhizobium leguminosarum]MBY2968134.1 hypothetical protein [Rhizobium leguminosarum]